jgi:hypothetical protein
MCKHVRMHACQKASNLSFNVQHQHCLMLHIKRTVHTISNRNILLMINNHQKLCVIADSNKARQ